MPHRAQGGAYASQDMGVAGHYTMGAMWERRWTTRQYYPAGNGM